MPMPERLNRVTVALSTTTVEIPWDTRDQLLAEMRHLDGAKPTIQAFTGAGASAPVVLRQADKELLVQVMNEMWRRR